MFSTKSEQRNCFAENVTEIFPHFDVFKFRVQEHDWLVEELQEEFTLEALFRGHVDHVITRLSVIVFLL